MPDNFTVFTASNREPNIPYDSDAYTVPIDTVDRMVRFTLTNLDIVNEPDTTVIHWLIERNDGSGWMHMVGGSFHGLNGIVPHRPWGYIATNIDGIRGEQIRGSISFESAGDRRRRFGVSGETY